MKKQILFLVGLFCLISFNLVAQNSAPEFVAGQEAMKEFFNRNAKPKKPAIASAGQGEVIIEFTVTETLER